MELDRLIDEFEAVAAGDATVFGDDSLCRRAVALHRLGQLAAVAESRTLAELDERQTTDVLFGSPTPRWLADKVNGSLSSARRRVKTAVRLRGLLREVDAAWERGEISDDHVRVFHDAANPRIADEIAARQPELLAAARELSFVRWRQLMAMVVYELDQDGAFDPDEERERNTAQFSETIDGSCRLVARFDRLTYARIKHLVDQRARELLDVYTKRREASGHQLRVPTWPTLRALAFDELVTAGAAATHPGRPVRDATIVLTPDSGTAETDATAPASTPGNHPGTSTAPTPHATPAPTPATAHSPTTAPHAHGTATPGQPVTIDLRRGWRAWTLDGLHLPGSADLAAHLCDAAFGALVVDTDGTPLSMGRTTRLFTAAQRRAIAIRDGGCVFPPCDRTPDGCHIHHIDWWQRDHGPTDTDNGATFCSRDHGIAHRKGWNTYLTPDGWTWFQGPRGSFWGQRHGIQRTGPTPDHPDYQPPQAIPPPIDDRAPPDHPEHQPPTLREHFAGEPLALEPALTDDLDNADTCPRARRRIHRHIRTRLATLASGSGAGPPPASG